MMMFEYWQKRLRAICEELDDFYTEADESGVYSTAETNKISEAIQRLEIEASDLSNKHEEWNRRYQRPAPSNPDGTSHFY